MDDFRAMTDACLQRIENAVTEAEKHTRAELLVVINRQSGSYADRELLFAVVTGVLLHSSMILSEQVFPDTWLLPCTILAGALAFALARLLPPLRRALVTAARRQHQVLVGARNAFCALEASATRERTGLLIYVSQFEDRLFLLPDYGLESKVEPAAWQRLLEQIGPPSRHADLAAALEQFLRQAGDLLARAFPPGASNPDEIPNHPHLEVR